MTAAGSWLLLSLALLLFPWPPDRRAGDARRRGGHRARGRPRPAGSAGSARRHRLGVGVAAIGIGGACLTMLGPIRGAALAAVICPLAVAGLRALQRREGGLRADRSVALALDLAAAALRSGCPLADALAVAAPAANASASEALRRVSGLLRLGAQPGPAWAIVAPDGPLGPIAAAAVRSSASGLRLAATFERLAEQIRADAAASASVRAQRAGVAAMGPLAAFFLPSFVCLGIVPVIVGIARSALGVLPH